MLAAYVPDTLAVLFIAVGAYVSLRTAVSLLFCVYNAVLRSGKSLKYYGAGNADSWALITGASDGIGKEYALQLAHAGFNVVLLARNKEKLDSVAAQITQAHAARKTLVIPFDFSVSTDATPAYEGLIAQLDILPPMRVLVNNVGKSHDMPCNFIDESMCAIRDIINVNITAAVSLTHAVAKRMPAKSLILNVGSFAGLYPQPMLGVYSGTKAFLLTWTQALAKELERAKVDVEYVAPYYVASAMSKIRTTSLTVPSPRAFVRASLAKVGNGAGSQSRPFSSSPYPSHAAIIWLIDTLVPGKLLLKVTHGMLSGIRARALRKRERESKAKVQ